MHKLQKRWCLWHPPSLIPFHLSFDLQSTVVVYIWYIPYAECGSCVFRKRINGIGQKLAKNHLSRTDQQRVGPIWSTSLRVDYCYLKFSDHNGSITKPAYLHLDRHVRQISSVTLAKPALVYTSIHSTVTTRYSWGDSLRLDFTCGRSGSFKVRRERARRPWDRFSQ
jgi:hypothetical protein